MAQLRTTDGAIPDPCLLRHLTTPHCYESMHFPESGFMSLPIGLYETMEFGLEFRLRPSTLIKNREKIITTQSVQH